MIETIKNFPKQFEYEPTIENADNFKIFDRFIVLGMGGSHLGADLLKIYKPGLNLKIYSDYDLPSLPDEYFQKSLIVAISYSGSTEETISGFNAALSKNFPLAVITINEKLSELAHQNKIPYVQLPDAGIPSRLAVGYQIKALLKIIGDENALVEIKKLSNAIDINKLEEKGRELAERIKNYIPIIYSSRQNQALAYFWKINFNETSKIPAFYNVFPELNHNEIDAFNWNEQVRELCNKFCLIFLKNLSDNPRIIKRMEFTEKILLEKTLKTEILEIEGANVFQKIFNSIVLSCFTSYYSAVAYNQLENPSLIDKLKSIL